MVPAKVGSDYMSDQSLEAKGQAKTSSSSTAASNLENWSFPFPVGSQCRPTLAGFTTTTTTTTIIIIIIIIIIKNTHHPPCLSCHISYNPMCFFGKQPCQGPERPKSRCGSWKPPPKEEPSTSSGVQWVDGSMGLWIASSGIMAISPPPNLQGFQ